MSISTFIVCCPLCSKLIFYLSIYLSINWLLQSRKSGTSTDTWLKSSLTMAIVTTRLYNRALQPQFPKGQQIAAHTDRDRWQNQYKRSCTKWAVNLRPRRATSRVKSSITYCRSIIPKPLELLHIPTLHFLPMVSSKF